MARDKITYCLIKRCYNDAILLRTFCFNLALDKKEIYAKKRRENKCQCTGLNLGNKSCPLGQLIP